LLIWLDHDSYICANYRIVERDRTPLALSIYFELIEISRGMMKYRVMDAKKVIDILFNESHMRNIINASDKNELLPAYCSLEGLVDCCIDEWEVR
jgi:hypothetical protein